jgi:hypothetical protein
VGQAVLNSHKLRGPRLQSGVTWQSGIGLRRLNLATWQPRLDIKNIA